jgi:spore coat protein A
LGTRHAQGATANNVYAGLAGFYLLRNPAFDASLDLPVGIYEIPLAIQDRDVQTTSSPASLIFFQPPEIPAWHHLAIVNGKVTPYLDVEPRRYRFRILNGANSDVR